MNKFEKDVQKALGLLKSWDVYVRFRNETFYTIFTINAVSSNDACAKIREYLCKDKKTPQKRIIFIFASLEEKLAEVYVAGPAHKISD